MAAVPLPPPRSGTPADRRPRPDPLAFREGLARGLHEASDRAVRRLVAACREDLRLAMGGDRAARDALAFVRRPLAGAARARRLALGVFDPAGELVATIDAYRDVPAPGRWLLGFLLVRPDLRGRGLATGLVARVERLAAARGCARLEAVTPARNPAMLQFLRRAGFALRAEVVLSIAGRAVRGLHLARDLVVAPAPAFA
jgi:GNAT superfamily N-acetyltransferase